MNKEVKLNLITINMTVKIHEHRLQPATLHMGNNL